MTLVSILWVRFFLAISGGEPCAAYDAAWDSLHSIGVCDWDSDVEDGECSDDGDDTLRTLFFACHGNEG